MTPTNRAGWAVVLCGLAGCGPGGADVSGTVTLNGRPVGSGTVTLLAADGTAHRGSLSAGGAFAVAGVPPGEARVCVVSPDPARRPDRGGPPATAPDRRRAKPNRPGDWFPVPAQFGQPSASPVTVRVPPGGGVLNVDLR